MKILFLDTETSGLSSFHDNIIEIAGLLIELDTTSLESTIIDSYSSLISLETELNPKITRITNISVQDLASAPSRSKIQMEWNDWINSHCHENDKIIICGHSIAFDIGFLKSERWFLPPEYDLLDTLDLSKILAPDSEGVNLEYLTRKFSLNPLSSPLTKHYVQKLEAHRALFDTFAAYLLFEFLLNRLMSLPLDTGVKQKIATLFFPLSLTFYTKKITQPYSPPVCVQASEALIRIDGSPQPLSFSEQVSFLGKNAHLNLIEKEILHSDNSQVIRALSQLYSIAVFRRVYPLERLKFHAKDSVDFIILEIVLSLCLDQNHTPTIGRMNYLEDFMSRIEQVSYDHFELGRLIQLVDTYSMFQSKKLTSSISTTLTQFTSSYDFLLVSIQQLLRYGEYSHDPQSTSAESINMGIKLSEVFQHLKELAHTDTSSESPILGALVAEIKKLAGSFSYSNRTHYQIKLKKGSLTISWRKQDFDINTHLQSLLTSYTQVIIDSYLSYSEIESLLKILKIAAHPLLRYDSRVNPENHITPHVVYSAQIDSYIDGLKDSNDSNLPSLIISGQTKSYKAIEYYLINNYATKDFLMVGESGSFSKVMSKMHSTFSGVLLLKLTEADFLMRAETDFDFASITIVLEPYLFIKDYFNTITAIESSLLKKLYTTSLYNKFFTKWKKQVIVVQSINR